MRRTYFYLSCVILFFSFISCQRNKISEGEKKKSHLIFVDENDYLNKSIEFIDSVRYVKLETLPNSIIGKINRIEIISDTIIIFDNGVNKVLSFDLTGKFIAEIGRKGNGPGEFARISTFAIDHKNKIILLFDVNRQRILNYTLSGNFISSSFENAGIWPHSFCIQNGEFIFYQNKTPNFNKDKTFYDLLFVKESKKIAKKYFEFTSDFKPWYSPKNTFYYLNDTLNFIRFFEAEIYSIIDDNIKIKYKIDFSGNNLPHEFTKDDKIFDDQSKNYSYLFRYFLESNDHIYFDYLKKGKLFFSLMDKSSLTIKTIKNSSNYLSVFLFQPVYVYEDYFVAVSEPSLILDGKARNDIEDVNLKEISDTIEFTDNPVLIFYRLKKF